jgi:hypothetical protein
VANDLEHGDLEHSFCIPKVELLPHPLARTHIEDSSRIEGQGQILPALAVGNGSSKSTLSDAAQTRYVLLLLLVSIL